MQTEQENRPKNTVKALLFGLMATVVFFFIGFFAIYLFWSNMEHDPNLPGLFDYLASSWGDRIALPLLAGTLVAYSIEREGAIKKPQKNECIFGGIGLLLGALCQAEWLISDSTGCNWTIPRLHYFNAAGWYHAGFFTFMFAFFGFFLVRFWRLKCDEIKGRTEETVAKVYADPIQIIIQAALWFSGAFFLFLHVVDDYASNGNFFEPLLISLVLVLAALVLYFLFIFIKAKKHITKQGKPEIASVLSGVVGAYAVVNIMCGGFHVDPLYVVAGAMLLTVLIIPDETNIPQVILFYLLIALPTLLLECAIPVQHTTGANLVLTILFITVPCIIAECQIDASGAFMRKSIMAAVLILGYISILVFDIDKFDLENVVSFVFVWALHDYIVNTFKDLTEREKEDMEKGKKKRILTYSIYACIMVGGLLLLKDVFFPVIPLSEPFDIIGSVQIISIVLAAIGAFILLLFGKKGKQSAGKKITALFCMALIYSIISIGTFSTEAPSKIVDSGYVPYVLLLVIPIFCYSISIVCSFVNNLCLIRGVAIDSYTKVGLAIIWLGLMSNVTISAVNMVVYRSVLSVSLNLVVVMFVGAGVPALTGRVLRRKCPQPQITRNSQIEGLAQDGFTYGFSIFITECLADFTVMKFKNVCGASGNAREWITLEAFFALATFIALISWILKMCIENNFKNYRSLKAAVNISEDGDTTQRQLTALRRYLSIQNLLALGNTFPFSVVVVVTIIRDYINSNKKGWRSLKDRFCIRE